MKTSVQDGVFAWLLCVASFLNILMMGGFLYASGMFYLMFKDALDATDSEVALITSINIGAIHFICPFAGILSERSGVRCVSMVGAVLSTAALASAAFSTQVYHLYLNYGLVAGIGIGTVFNCSVTILDPYFKKYKRTALGLTMSGLGAGSFVFPPILKYLKDIYGWRGAILLMAGINAHKMVFSSLFIPFKAEHCKKDDPIYIENTTVNDKLKSYGEDGNQLHIEENLGRVVKSRGLEYEVRKFLSLFKIIPYLCIMVTTLIIIFAVSIIITHFGSYVLTLGFSNEDVVTLYMTFGLSATIARPLTGIIAQVINANTAAFITLAACINGTLTLCLPFTNQLWMLYVYVVMFHLLLSSHSVLAPVIIMEHVPTSQVGVAFGLYCAACVPGYALGAPIAALLYSSMRVYTSSFFLAGGILILAGLSMVPAAYHIQRKRTQSLSVQHIKS